ncbi:hypothetical protein ROSEINA2194_00899 [Roseburia inulinivorans DSM 16841]|uniref:Uncharacterized protein n=1 Tax=Roseburia inulinivorans DSM 16841 TaxID=622312 RepID=C0FQ96_9FIRM|nr:hypothetical protein ROSEINA2194_00899 [Roseburia inulinivorans DSM 16841]
MAITGGSSAQTVPTKSIIPPCFFEEKIRVSLDEERIFPPCFAKQKLRSVAPEPIFYNKYI